MQEEITFSINFTVCSSDADCLAGYESSLRIAYKAGNCVFYDEITETEKLALVLNPKDVTCYNGNDGAVETQVTGGTMPYSFLWNTGSTMSGIQNLPAGIYSVTVTDSMGNSVEKSVEVMQPETSLNMGAEILNASCNASDGGVNLTVTGGTPPYHFRWNNGDTTQNLTDVPKGSYIVTLTDDAGCGMSKSVKVDENSTLAAQLSPNYLQCYQQGHGEITAEVTGGTAPYDYQWSNGDTGQDISGVNSGLYNLTVTDAMGCSVTKSAYVGIRTLSVSTTVNSPTCSGGDDGELSVTNVGYGTAPFNYLWNTGDTTATVSGLESGKYIVTVTDSFGCSVTRSITVSDRPELSLSYSVSPRNCMTDSTAELSFIGSGGNGDFEFYLGDSLITSPATLPGNGDYEIVMRDGTGCELTKTITIASSGPITVIPSITQPSCTGLQTGYAVFTATGGTSPYTYKWSDGTTTSSETNLLPGNYSVDVVDANGCFSSTSFTISSIPTVTAEINEPGR